MSITADREAGCDGSSASPTQPRRPKPSRKSTATRLYPMLNLNRANLSIEPINTAINAAIERAAATTAKLPRPYLGVSIVGHKCLRRIQFDWWISPELPARTREILDRGHYF